MLYQSNTGTGPRGLGSRGASWFSGRLDDIKRRKETFMTGITKRYNIDYKKRVDVERDTYLPIGSPKGLLSCAGCGAIYYRRRWTLNPPEKVRLRVDSMAGASFAVCPACRKIREHYPFGELKILGASAEEKGEILRLLKNEEAKAREKNPLARIMAARLEGTVWRVDTTTEKLAQHLGRALKKARGGEVTYHWSHNNKFVRVVWKREALETAA
jgi:NMD protein affecting ribosome stability and mRNA decay